MANIDKLNFSFTDGQTTITANHLNSFVDRINKLIDAVGGDTPTPTQTVATPTISISGSTATISCSTSGTTIRYAINGTPTESSGTIIANGGTISLSSYSQSTVIRAIAYKSGMTTSQVGQATYTPSSQRSPEAQAVINKFNNMSSANQDKVADFVDSLVSAGIYSKLNYLMIPTVAGSVAEGVQNVLSSVTPPSVSNAIISDGLKMTGVGVIDLNNMINGTFDYQNYTIAIKVEDDDSLTSGVNRVLTLSTAPDTAQPTANASRFGITNTSSGGVLAYDGYAAQKTLTQRFGIVRHNNTALSEAYYTNDALTNAADTKTLSENNGLYLSSNKTQSENTLRGCFTGTYKILVVAGVLSDTEMSALATAINTFLS